MGFFDFFKKNDIDRMEITYDERIPFLTYTYNFDGIRIRFILAPYSELVNFLLNGNTQEYITKTAQYIEEKIKEFYGIKDNGEFIFIDKDNVMTHTNEAMYFIDKRIYDENLLDEYESLVGKQISNMEKIPKTDIEINAMLNTFKNRY